MARYKRCCYSNPWLLLPDGFPLPDGIVSVIFGSSNHYNRLRRYFSFVLSGFGIWHGQNTIIQQYSYLTASDLRPTGLMAELSKGGAVWFTFPQRAQLSITVCSIPAPASNSKDGENSFSNPVGGTSDCLGAGN